MVLSDMELLTQEDVRRAVCDPGWWLVGSRCGPACRPPTEQSSWWSRWCTGREDIGKRLATSLPAVLADHRPLQVTLRVLARTRWQCGPLSPQPSARLVWGVSLACGPAGQRVRGERSLVSCPGASLP